MKREDILPALQRPGMYTGARGARTNAEWKADAVVAYLTPTLGVNMDTNKVVLTGLPELITEPRTRMGDLRHVTYCKKLTGSDPADFNLCRFEPSITGEFFVLTRDTKDHQVFLKAGPISTHEDACSFIVKTAYYDGIEWLVARGTLTEFKT